MKSIRSRITRLIIIVTIIAVLLAGGVSFMTLRLQEDVGSERFMSLICETGSEHINENLFNTEQAVISVVKYVDESLDSMELVKGGIVGATGSGISLRDHDYESGSQQAFDSYLTRHIHEVETVFSSTVAQNESVLGYYYRVNPEISRAQKGFLRSKIAGGDYADREPTDIRDYASNDYKNVGWYYLPQETGRPTWIDPYFDLNQQTDVVSFIAPLYKADTFIGVVGIDITYDSLVSQITNLDILTSGYAFLTNSHGDIIYHPTLPRQMSLADVNSELQSAGTDADTPSLITYTLDNVEKKAAWQTLENGMRLFVCAPSTEVNARSYGATTLMLAGIAAIMALLIIAVLLEVRRITKPLEELTAAATEIAEGNYDVNLTYDKEDEVGILTNSFRHLVDNLKVRIAYLYNQAYKDGLTSVRNKAAYNVYTSDLNSLIKRGESIQFAIVAFDCNELKRVNDTYGHEKGDIYLKNACHAICESFAHSPVFRVGGDEFTCILEGHEFERRDELVHSFLDYERNTSESASEAWEKVNLAMGIAEYDPDRDTDVEDVARRADDLMYQNKNEYKARKRADKLG